MIATGSATLLGQAEALNRFGEHSSRTAATGQARERHARALAIAREFSALLKELRALEGLGVHVEEPARRGKAA